MIPTSWGSSCQGYVLSFAFGGLSGQSCAFEAAIWPSWGSSCQGYGLSFAFGAAPWAGSSSCQGYTLSFPFGAALWATWESSCHGHALGTARAVRWLMLTPPPTHPPTTLDYLQISIDFPTMCFFIFELPTEVEEELNRRFALILRCAFFSF